MKKKSGEEKIESQILFEIEKSKKQRIRGSLGLIKKTVFIDLRTFYEDSVTGCFEPSRAGLTFHPELLASLIDALQKANAAIHRK